MICQLKDYKTYPLSFDKDKNKLVIGKENSKYEDIMSIILTPKEFEEIYSYIPRISKKNIKIDEVEGEK